MDEVNQKFLVEQFKQAHKKPEGEYLAFVESLLKEGLDPNTDDESGCECLLEDGIGELSFSDKDHLVLPLIQLFLRYGFDVKRDEGRYGTDLLIHLKWLKYDDDLWEMADCLLKAGADLNAEPHGEESALSYIDFSRSDGQVTGRYDCGSCAELVARIYERFLEGKPYVGIRTGKTFVGKTIKEVNLFFYKEETASQYQQVDDSNYQIALAKGELVFIATDGTPLVFCFGQNILIDPYWKDSKKKYFVDTSFFNDLLGLTVTGCGFYKNDSECGVELTFSNGRKLIGRCESYFEETNN